jgi:pimeloyl-ACP methyl ester carboxylesterase
MITETGPGLKTVTMHYRWYNSRKGHKVLKNRHVHNSFKSRRIAMTSNLPSATGKYVKANGLNIYYEEYGGGKPLLLLHGGTQTSAGWYEDVPFFVEHFRVITPDSRGHGRTNNPAGELSYRMMAADVAAFIQAIGLVKPIILGYSDGGQIALEIGMGYPGLASALVVGGVYYQLSGSIIKFIRSLGFEGPGVLNSEKIRDEDPEMIDEMKKAHVSSNNPEYWRTLLEQLSRMWWTPLGYTKEDFQKITEPTLVLLGDRDVFSPVEQAVEIYRSIPNAELAVIPGATHSSTINELTKPIILDFLMRRNVAVI